MYQSRIGVMRDEEYTKLNLMGEFDGLQTFEQVNDLVFHDGSVDRLALDFSHASRVKPLEIYYLLAELSANPNLSDIQVSIEGLQCEYRYESIRGVGDDVP